MNKWWKTDGQREKVIEKIKKTLKKTLKEKYPEKVVQNKSPKRKKMDMDFYFEEDLFEIPSYREKYWTFKQEILKKCTNMCNVCLATKSKDTPNLTLFMCHKTYKRHELFKMNNLVTEQDVINCPALWNLDDFMALCGKCKYKRYVKKYKPRKKKIKTEVFGGYEIPIETKGQAFN